MIAVACDEDGVVALDVAEGQRNDAPLAEAVLIEARDAVGMVRDVLGDKGFDSDAVRDVVLDDLDALPVIPNRSNRREPWPWDGEMREAEKQRNRVERAFGKTEQFRRFTSRHQKLKEVYPQRGPRGLRIYPRPEARLIRRRDLKYRMLDMIDVASHNLGKSTALGAFDQRPVRL